MASEAIIALEGSLFHALCSRILYHATGQPILFRVKNFLEYCCCQCGSCCHATPRTPPLNLMLSI